MIIPYPNAWERGAVVVVMVGLSQTLSSPPDQEDIISNPGLLAFRMVGIEINEAGQIKRFIYSVYCCPS